MSKNGIWDSQIIEAGWELADLQIIASLHKAWNTTRGVLFVAAAGAAPLWSQDLR